VRDLGILGVSRHTRHPPHAGHTLAGHVIASRPDLAEKTSLVAVAAVVAAVDRWIGRHRPTTVAVWGTVDIRWMFVHNDQA